MADFALTIKRLRLDQIDLAQAAVSDIAGDAANFRVKAVRDLKSTGDQVEARLIVSQDPAARIAQEAIWKALENQMRLRGIVWQTPAGRSDALSNERAITIEQIEIVALTFEIRTSVHSDCSKATLGKSFKEWDEAVYEAQVNQSDPVLRCVQIWEMPTNRFQNGKCRVSDSSDWRSCGPHGE